MKKNKCKCGHIINPNTGFCDLCLDEIEKIINKNRNKIDSDSSRIIQAHKEQKFLEGC